MTTRLHNHHSRATFITLLALSGPAAASPITWDGSCGNNIWTSQCGPNTNWDPESLPGVDSDVSIESAVVSLGGTGNAGTLNCQGGLNVTGLLNVTLIGEIKNLNMSSSLWGISTPGLVTLTGSPIWFTGRVMGGGSVENTGNLAGHAIAVLEESAFLNSSTMTVDLSISNSTNCTFINNAGGTLTHTLNSVTSGVHGLGIFRNYGTLKHQLTGQAILNIENRFEQLGGQFICAGGSPNGTGLTNGGQYSGGTWNLSDNSNLSLTGPTHIFDGLTSITGQGNVTFNVFVGTEVRVEQPLEVNLTGTKGLQIQTTGNLVLVDKLINKGKARWLAGTIDRESCTGCPGELVNESQFVINGGGPLKATLSNTSSATIRAEGGFSVAAGGLVYNEGTFEHVRGNIGPVGSISFGAFRNLKDYVRPDEPTVQDVIIDIPFELAGNGKILAHKGIVSFAQGALKFNTTGLAPHIQIDDGAEVVIGGGLHRVVSGATTGALGEGTLRIVGSGFGGGLMTELGSQFIAFMGGPSGDGRFVLGPGGRITGPGEVVNTGEMEWNSGTVGAGRLVNEFGGTLYATGGVVDGAAGLVSNFGEVHHITGVIFLSNLGQIENGAESDDGVAGFAPGIWSMGPGSASIGGASGEFRNLGLLEASLDPGHTAVVSCSFDNDGTVEALHGPLVFTGPVAQLAAGRLNGGEWRVAPTASLELPGTLSSVGAGTTLYVAGQFNDLKTITHNSGNVTVKDFQTNGSFINDGEWNIEDGTTTVGPGGTGAVNCILGFLNTHIAPALTASATVPTLICATLNNGGTIRPGSIGAAGPFNIVGNLVQTELGVVEIELGGTVPGSTHDQATVQGNATLDGTLHVEALGGFVPSVGQQFTVLTVSGTMTGQFDSISGPGQFSVAYQPHAVVLTTVIPPNPADLSGDGHVSGIDLAMLLGQWTGSATYSPCPPHRPADLNQDCRVNGLDLAILLGVWG